MSGTISGFLVWFLTVISLENSWLRINSTGGRQWMIYGTLKKLLTEPLKSVYGRVYWTNVWMALHNVYLMLLFGIAIGIIVAIVCIAIQRQNSYEKSQ